MNALLLLDDGWAAERVAEVLFIDAETVPNIAVCIWRRASPGSSG